MIRYVGTLAFDGTGFVGWQTQKNGQSIQEEVERVLSQILNEPIVVHGSSRTDAGVHAEGFMFHMDTTSTLKKEDIVRGFNRLVHPQLVLRSLQKVNPSFEAQFTPSIKTYRYQLYTGMRNPFLSRYAHYYYLPMNVTLLKKVSRLFVGTYRFHNFTVKEDDQLNFIRTIRSIRMSMDDQILTITFVGKGFMTHMVRMIVGTFLAVQEGKLTMHDVQTKLSGTSVRQPVSFKAPPHGLYLEKVHYAKT